MTEADRLVRSLKIDTLWRLESWYRMSGEMRWQAAMAKFVGNEADAELYNARAHAIDSVLAGVEDALDLARPNSPKRTPDT